MDDELSIYLLRGELLHASLQIATALAPYGLMHSKWTLGEQWYLHEKTISRVRSYSVLLYSVGSPSAKHPFLQAHGRFFFFLSIYPPIYSVSMYHSDQSFLILDPDHDPVWTELNSEHWLLVQGPGILILIIITFLDIAHTVYSDSIIYPLNQVPNTASSDWSCDVTSLSAMTSPDPHNQVIVSVESYLPVLCHIIFWVFNSI